MEKKKENFRTMKEKGGNVVNVEIVKNENMGERLAAYAEKSAK
ncbi:hypothetical protein [Roseburia yibonii]|nr:hypothetical protein [Roseburia yibonii]